MMEVASSQHGSLPRGASAYLGLMLRALSFDQLPTKLVLGLFVVLVCGVGLRGIEAVDDPTIDIRFGEVPARPSLERHTAEGVMRAAMELVLEPPLWVVSPWLRLFRPIDSWAQLGRLCLRALIGLGIMSWAGACIGRMTAATLARRQPERMFSTCVLVGRRFVTMLVLLLSPLLGFSIFAGVCALGGVASRLPSPVGPAISTLVYSIAFVAAIPAALLVIGWATSWPLMVMCVAVDDSDTLDGLSRSLGYVMRRKFLTLFLAVAGFLLATGGLLAFCFFLELVVELTTWAVGLGSGRRSKPTGWDLLANILAHSWCVSAFWSLIAAAYIGVRMNIDGTNVSRFDLNTSAEGTTQPEICNL